MTVNYTMRFPDELHTQLSDLAKAEGRSFHGQVLHLLTDNLPAAQRKALQRIRAAAATETDEQRALREYATRSDLTGGNER